MPDYEKVLTDRSPLSRWTPACERHPEIGMSLGIPARLGALRQSLDLVPHPKGLAVCKMGC